MAQKIITFVTGNQGKFKEVSQILSSKCAVEQLDLDLPELQSLDPQQIIAHKAQSAAEKFNQPFIVEDQALIINCLNQLPGPFIKWFEKSLGNQGIYDLIKHYSDHSAKNIVSYGYFVPGQQIQYFTGVTEGEIVEPAGDLDFGWGPIFKPHGADETYGQMTPHEKGRFSPRILALNKLKEHL